MASQTVTTSVNYDAASIAGLLDGEAITINGGSVTINADVRWNQQAAVFGSITLSATLGGSFLIDGSQIWEVPFSASTGNVPTQNALASNGVTGGTSGAAGELTRVWASGSLTPATAGGAMPSTGFIKLRSRTGNFVSGETITLPGGATITASGPGKRSWIHVVGSGNAAGNGGRLTIPRLASFQATGDWYELGTTNGADNQTLQCPVADTCPAVWIETAAGSGVYEIWLCAGDRWTSGYIATTDKRGMFFGCDSTTGVITLALRGGTNAGLKPLSGCKVRVPNVILSSAVSSNWSANFVPTTRTNAYSFTTTAGGAWNMSRVTSNWHCNVTSPFSVSIIDCAINTQLAVSNVGSTTTIRNCGIGFDVVSSQAMTIGTCYSGGVVEDCVMARRTSGFGNASFALAECANLEFNRLKNYVFPDASDTYGFIFGYSVSRADSCNFANCAAIGGNGFSCSTYTNSRIADMQFASRISGTTRGSDGTYAILFQTASAFCEASGFSNFDGLANVHPFTYVFGAESGSNNITFSNIGTPASPYDCGTLNATGVGINLGGCKTITVRRCYFVNTRTRALSTATGGQDLAVYNLWGDVADSHTTNSNNTTIQGGRFTLSTAGQSSCYGTHWCDAWASATTGRIHILCNEPTEATVGQCAATLGSGSGFTSAGNVVMSRLTDEIVWTMPYFALGVTGFANAAPTITGTNTANHTLEFQFDTGSGFNGTWLALTGANLSAIGVNPNVGVRLRVRARVNTASTSNLLSFIRIDTVTDATSQQIEYPLPGAIVTVASLVPGSRVKVTRADTGALLAQDSTSGTSLTLDVPYSGAVRIEARNASGATTYRPWVTQLSIATGATTSVTALQEQD